MDSYQHAPPVYHHDTSVHFMDREEPVVVQGCCRQGCHMSIRKRFSKFTVCSLLLLAAFLATETSHQRSSRVVDSNAILLTGELATSSSSSQVTHHHRQYDDEGQDNDQYHRENDSTYNNFEEIEQHDIGDKQQQHQQRQPKPKEFDWNKVESKGQYDWQKCKNSNDPDDCWKTEADRVHSYWENFGQRMKSYWSNFGLRMRNFWASHFVHRRPHPNPPHPDEEEGPLQEVVATSVPANTETTSKPTIISSEQDTTVAEEASQSIPMDSNSFNDTIHSMTQ